MSPTRCYAMSPSERYVALAKNALSDVPELGLPAMTLLMESFRPRVASCVAPLHAGMRGPILTQTAYTEHALVTLAAQLDRCTACTDDALHAWVSIQTTRAVLDLHRALRQSARARRRPRNATPSVQAA